MSNLKSVEEALSSKGKFYNLLRGKKINDKDYENPVKVWNAFK